MNKTFNEWLQYVAGKKLSKEKPKERIHRDPSSCICDEIARSSAQGNVAGGFCPYHRTSWL